MSASHPSGANIVSEIDIKADLFSIIDEPEWGVGERVRRRHDTGSLDLFQSGFSQYRRRVQQQDTNSCIPQERPVQLIEERHRFISALQWRLIYREAPPVMSIHQVR